MWFSGDHYIHGIAAFGVFQEPKRQGFTNRVAIGTRCDAAKSGAIGGKDRLTAAGVCIGHVLDLDNMQLFAGGGLPLSAR